jgi:hypothetical protein
MSKSAKLGHDANKASKEKAARGRLFNTGLGQRFSHVQRDSRNERQRGPTEDEDGRRDQTLLRLQDPFRIEIVLRIIPGVVQIFDIRAVVAAVTNAICGRGEPLVPVANA